MYVKGNDISNAHAYELLERDGTVERFSAAALVLSALVYHRHNDRDTSRLAADGTDYALEVLIVVVGAHALLNTVHLICYAVVEQIAENVNIVSAHRLVQHAFSLSVRKADGVRARNKAVYMNIGIKERCVRPHLFLLRESDSLLAAPLSDPIVDLPCKVLVSLSTDNTELAVQFVCHYLFIPSFSFRYPLKARSLISSAARLFTWSR